MPFPLRRGHTSGRKTNMPGLHAWVRGRSKRPLPYLVGLNKLSFLLWNAVGKMPTLLFILVGFWQI